MSKDKAEEKAKRYTLENLEENGYRNFHGGECVEDAYTAGYTQAVTDLSAENEKLREALRELVESLDGWHHENMGISVEIAKAKQLLADKE